MKRNVFKVFIVITFIVLCLIFYIANTTFSKPTGSIDLTGGNDFWKAYLNIHLQYDSVLMIVPGSDSFSIPSEISIDITVNNKCIYTDRLKYIPNSNKNSLGKYTATIKSNELFKKDISNVYLIIRFNDKSSSIMLNPRPQM